MKHLPKLGHLFGTNGIRGIPGKDLSPDVVSSVARAVAAKLGHSIVVGMDGRLSSPALKELVISSLLESGSDVVDVGMLPTPALQYYISRGRFGGGIMITASHNPPEFNGLKVMGGNGVEVPRSVEKEIEKLVESKKPRKPADRPGELREDRTGVEKYVAGVKSQVDVRSIKMKHFRIVVDAGNGMQALAVPLLLKELGATVKCINCEVNGAFPGRGPEPTAEKLANLSNQVARGGYDLGVAFDGDGDRSVFCDERGMILTGDRSGSFLAEFLLRVKGKNKVVTTIATSSLADWAVEPTGSELIRTRVGSVDVTDTMIKEKALVGFEENGGFFYLPHQPVRDGAMTLGLVLWALSYYGTVFSRSISRLPRLYQRKGKTQAPNEIKYKAVEEVAKSADGAVDTTDGVKVTQQDGSWVLVRASGTEPLIRVFSESRVESEAEELYKKYMLLVEQIIRKQR